MSTHSSTGQQAGCVQVGWSTASRGGKMEASSGGGGGAGGGRRDGTLALNLTLTLTLVRTPILARTLASTLTLARWRPRSW